MIGKYREKIIEYGKKMIIEAVSDVVMGFYLGIGISIAIKVFFNL